MDLTAAIAALKKDRPLLGVPPYMPREIVYKRSVAEHEVFMSFSSDDDAGAFTDWIGGGGWASFLAWFVARDQDGD